MNETFDKIVHQMGYTGQLPGLFIDIDGTLIDHETEEVVGNSVEMVNTMYEAGFHIILTTRRGQEFSSSSRYSQESTLRLLESLGIKYHDILFGVPSPRIVINDQGAFGENINMHCWGDSELIKKLHQLAEEMLKMRRGE